MDEPSVVDAVEETDEPIIRFHINSDRDHPEEVLRVERDGKFYVKGEEVETNEQIRDLFARWVRFCLGK